MPKFKNPVSVVKNMTDGQKAVTRRVAVYVITAAVTVAAIQIIDKKLDANLNAELTAE